MPGEETEVTVGTDLITYKFIEATGAFVPDGEEYGQPVWTWSKTETGMAAYATFTKPDGTSVTPNVTVELTATKAADCETPQTDTYTATCTLNGKTYTDTFDLVVGTPLGHDWDHTKAEVHAIYELLDGRTIDARELQEGEDIDLNDVDRMYVAAKVPCTRCGSFLTVDDVFLERDDAASVASTCTAAGYTLWNEYYVVGDVKYPVPGEDGLYKVELPLADHTWGDWETFSNSESATVYRRSCSVCGEIEESTHEHQYQLPEPNKPGEPVPNGVVWDHDGQGHVSSVTVTMTCTAGGGETEGDIEGSGTGAETATRTLFGDDIKITETPPTCTKDGQTIYTATLTEGGKDYTYTYVVTVPALGHNWAVADEDAAWHFESDEYGHVTRCTVTLTCINPDCYETMVLSSDEESEDEDYFLEVFDTYADPTCIDEGYAYAVAVAACGDDVFGKELINDVTDPMGHELVWTVEDIDYENKTATITITCTRGDVEEHVYKDYKLTEAKAPTCTEDGIVKFDITDEDLVGTAPIHAEEPVPALGHDWGEDGVCTRCGEKGPSYVSPTPEPTAEPTATPEPTATATPVPATATPEPTATATATPAATAAAKAPSTGDETALLPWTVMLLACAGALAVVLDRRRKER